MEEPRYPMRINKYLALHKYSTRKGGDLLVEQARVFINGRLASLGDKVQEGDVVDVRRGSEPERAYSYYAYNKPRGIITHSPQNGEKDIAQSIQLTGVFPIGRLDKDSEGLIILTDDGRITDRLLHPDHVHDKEYDVRVKHALLPRFKEKMEAGVRIEEYVTKKCRVTIESSCSFKIVLTEGKKHQIRRMVAALGNEVESLRRIRIMNITLGGLLPGDYRPIEGDERKTFLTSLGLPE